MDSGPRKLVLITAMAATVYLAGIFAAPLMDVAGSGHSRILRVCYKPVCHQMPERSIEVGGHPVAVCARCSGLYLGGLIGIWAGLLGTAWRRRTPKAVFWLAVAPTVVDALSIWMGLPGLSNVPRMFLALPAGAACGWFLAVGVADLAAIYAETGIRGFRFILSREG